jgi:spoIIIJ-associated protein
MSGFFKKLFGGKKKEEGGFSAESAEDLVFEVMNGLIEKAQLEIAFEMKSDKTGDVEEISIELSGNDEDLLTEKEGALLDAFQLFIKRVLQHQLPDARVNVNFDCNGYRDESSKALVELADKLKERALEQGRAVYVRALPPKDRKVVHQHLATDERVKSRSVGEGLYKKIKIFPVKASTQDSSNESENEVNETV